MENTNSVQESGNKAGGYRFLAILFFVLAVGGLFLGLLSNALKDKANYFFSLGALYEPGAIANSDKILGGSLIGVIWGVVVSLVNWFKTPNMANFNFIGEGGPTSLTNLIASFALLFFALLLIVTVVVSLVMMIVSLASGKSAKRCAMCSGIFTLLSYGGLFLFNYALTCCSGEKYNAFMFDFPTMAITAITLLALIITAIARRKGMGFLNVLNLLFTVVLFGAIAYPMTQPAAFIGANGYEWGKDFLFITIAMTALLVIIGFNLLCGSIRLCAKKRFFFEIVRFALQLVCGALVIIAFLVNPSTKSEVFGHDLIATIITIVALIPPIIVAIILFVMEKIAKAEQDALAAKRAAEEDEDDTDLEVDEDDEDYSDEINRAVFDRRPEPVPALAPVPENEPRNEPVAQPIIPSMVVPVPPQPQEETRPREKTDFERRMEAIAREEVPTETYYARPQAKEPTPAPAPQQPYPPVFPHYKKSTMQQMRIEDEQISPYMAGHYDPFISKLTSQEVSEFGDLFISNKYGMQNYLPVYVIGGNNDEFFNKVFIYLGRFRNYISSPLLEKLNVYVSAVRTQK